MIDKIFKIDISFFEGHASGDIQNRFNSVSEIYQFISITLISAIINAVRGICSDCWNLWKWKVYIASYHWWFG